MSPAILYKDRLNYTSQIKVLFLSVMVVYYIYNYHWLTGLSLLTINETNYVLHIEVLLYASLSQRNIQAIAGNKKHQKNPAKLDRVDLCFDNGGEVFKLYY